MTTKLKVLSKDEIYDIHAATLSVLEETGVRILDPKALHMLEEAKASVNSKTSIVRIPEHLLKEGIRKAPSSFTLFGRDKSYKLRFQRGRTYFSSQGASVFVLDFKTGMRRKATLKDLRSFYLLADALENVHHATLAVWPTDVPENVAHVHALLEGFRNTTKTLDGYHYGEKISMDSIEMARERCRSPRGVTRLAARTSQSF